MLPLCIVHFKLYHPHHESRCVVSHCICHTSVIASRHHSFFTNKVSLHVLCAANRHSEALPYVAFLESRNLYFFDKSITTNAEMQVIGQVCALCSPMTFKDVVS
jgi:hypothetical protein